MIWRLKVDRFQVAKVIKDITPLVASLGPPLPEALNIRWPKQVTNALLKFEEATATDVKIKDNIINKIRGR